MEGIDARATRFCFFFLERRRRFNGDDALAVFVRREIFFDERVVHEKRENGYSRVPERSARNDRISRHVVRASSAVRLRTQTLKSRPTKIIPVDPFANGS